MKKKELNFDLKQIKTFLEVIKENSFTKASRKMKIGQATVSHQINLLEEMLGVILINRNSKEFSITKQGMLFKTFCEKLLHDIEGLKININRDNFGNSIKICSSTIPSTYILPKIIVKMKNNYPDYFYKVDILNSRESVEMVKEGRADIGIVGKQLKHPSLKYEKIYSDEIVLIGSLKYPDIIKIDEITAYPFIIREKGSGTRDAYERYITKYNIIPSDLNVVYECSTSESIKESVISGMGVSFISRLALEKELHLKDLKIIKIKDVEIERDFYVVYLNNKKLIPPVQVFIQALTELRKK